MKDAAHPSTVRFRSANVPWTPPLAITAGLFALLWTSTVKLPRFPSNALDPSAWMVLGYAFERQLQFGKDIIFTYGPLGHLMLRTFDNIHFYSLLIWQFFFAAIVAWLLIRTARRLSPAHSVFYYLYFLLFATVYDDVLHIIVIVLVGLDLVTTADDNGHVHLVECGMLAISSTLKFTHFATAAAVIVFASCYDFACKRPRRAFSLVLAYCLTLLGVWTSIGQNPFNLPAYVLSSIEMSAGYNGAMTLTESGEVLTHGVVAAVALAAYVVMTYVRHPDKAKAFSLLGLFSAGAFIQWKHGFVRADGHVLGFFLYALLIVVSFPAWFKETSRRLHTAWLVPVCVASALGLYSATPWILARSLEHWKDRSRDTLHAFVTFDAFRNNYRVNWQLEQRAFDMSRVRQQVGRDPVDIVGNTLGVGLYNSVNYTPKPVFQSLMAYTPALLKANAAFYESKTAPRYVLQQYQTSIDNRFPTLEDSLVLRALVRDYAFRFVEKGYLLWERKQRPTAASSAVRFEIVRNIRFNERITLESSHLQNAWLSVEWAPSTLGSIRNVFYKPPSVNITVFTADNRVQTFRLAGSMAQEGFLLNPFIESQFDFLRFISGRQEKRITAFSIDVPASETKFFRDIVKIRLQALPASPAADVKLADYVDGLFQTVPVSIASSFPIEPVDMGVRHGLLVHAPGEMVFELAPESTVVSGRFGLAPGAYTDGHATDGAGFRIVWAAHGKTTVLFDRYLDPARRVEDRGLQSFRIDVSGLGEGALLFRTEPGPNTSWDWTVWSDITIEGIPSLKSQRVARVTTHESASSPQPR
jgi:hypothetical protein